MSERRATKEELEAVGRQLVAAMESGAEITQIDAAGSQFELRRASEGQYSLVSSDEDFKTDLFEPAESRPEGYPKNCPFISGEAVTVARMGAGYSLTWWAPRDPKALMSQLDELSVCDGYVLEQEREQTQIQMIERDYTDGESSRTIMQGGPMVTLMQEPVKNET